MNAITWGCLLASMGSITGKPTDKWENCVSIEVRKGVWGSSGVLIGPNVVLTTGQLAPDPQKPPLGNHMWRVFVGSDVTKRASKYQPDSDPVGGKIYRVRAIVRHPDFKREIVQTDVKGQPTRVAFLRNDLALLVLTEDVPGTVGKPARLAPAEVVDRADRVIVCGFGANEYVDGLYPRGAGVKRVVELAVRARNDNPAEQRAFRLTPEKEFVVYDPEGKADAASGDAGGPVCVMHRNEWHLAGIVSRTVPPTERTTKRGGDGSVCVRVDQYVEWITTAARQHKGNLAWR